MKDLNVKKVSAAHIPVEAIPALLDEEKIAFQSIATVNWADFPYAPEVQFRIAYTQDAILLHYKVKEASVRAVAGRDNGPVWEDACVEFFSVPAGDGIYYNVECNCAGALLVAAGSGREERQHAPQEVLDKVQRWASLGREPFEERLGDCTWEVALIIPFTTFFLHKITSLEGKTIRANFYKCGDKLQTPHFLSWNPIDLPSPNFHCPQFFGTLHL
ncbi:hypothetical protein EVA_21550 [gut metagenome]|uniref:Carbohydrate-binding domain-containing protein n=1 Tax=gut metagenome TaxID=749906 RepID=J9F7A3_9ZZZZ